MVLGDADSKLETFVWKVHYLASIHPKSIKRGQVTNLDVFFQVVVSLYRLGNI